MEMRIFLIIEAKFSGIALTIAENFNEKYRKKTI
jgi:hypothetical protein